MCSSVDGYYRLGATVLVACASPPLIGQAVKQESILGGDWKMMGTPGLFMYMHKKLLYPLQGQV